MDGSVWPEDDTQVMFGFPGAVYYVINRGN
jgi:hypothetical protein